MAVAAYRVGVEKVVQAHLAQHEFNAVARERLLQVEGIGRFFHAVRGERHGVVNEVAGGIHILTQRGIAHHVEIGERRDALCLAQAFTASLFGIENEFGPAG